MLEALAGFEPANDKFAIYRLSPGLATGPDDNVPEVLFLVMLDPFKGASQDFKPSGTSFYFAALCT